MDQPLSGEKHHHAVQQLISAAPKALCVVLCTGCVELERPPPLPLHSYLCRVTSLWVSTVLRAQTQCTTGGLLHLSPLCFAPPWASAMLLVCKDCHQHAGTPQGHSLAFGALFQYLPLLYTYLYWNISPDTQNPLYTSPGEIFQIHEQVERRI